jgi:type III pantothenate kinase
MNLLVDVGNSRLKWARAGTELWETAAAPLGDEVEDSVLDRLWLAMPAPQRVVVASVNEDWTSRVLDSWLRERWSLRAHVVRPQRELLGVRNHYRDPATLGADRWVALIAAHHLTAGPVCVIDCGTAVTIDALSADGDFLGGVILPGLHLLRASLVQGTKSIRTGDGDATTCLARSTADAVAAGTLFGLAGAVERVLAEHRQALGSEMSTLITGAEAGVVLPRLRAGGPIAEIPDLVLRGLAMIAENAL